MSIDARSPGVLAFTSGTTGPPKGIIRPRSLWYSKLEPFPSGGVALTYRASSRTGSSIPMIWRAMNGTRSDVINDDPGNIWERLRAGDVTYISCAPSGWARNMRYFNEHIDVLPAEERQQYVKGVRALQTPISAGEFTPHGVANFWQDLLGRPLLDMYGSTEMGVVWSRKIVSESGTEVSWV